MQQLIIFAEQLLRTLPLNGAVLYITNATGKILAGTGNEAFLGPGSDECYQEKVAISAQETWHIIAVENDERHVAALRIVKVTLETAIDSLLFTQANVRGPEEAIVEQLLAESDDIHPHELELSGIVRKHGFDTTLPRAVILIELEEKINRYFNINLDLGYDASALRAKTTVVQAVKENRYLNKQDIVAPYGYNQIVIIKAFMAISDTGKYYTALEKIALEVLNDLATSKIFLPRLAYGKVCDSLGDIKQSYQEAKRLLHLGSQTLGRNGLYRAEDLLAELMVFGLPSAIVEKILRPLTRRLQADGDETCHELLRYMETYILAGYNISETAQKLYVHRNTVAGKIEKYKAITGLDPGEHFDDAILTKLLAVYLRLEQGLAAK